MLPRRTTVSNYRTRLNTQLVPARGLDADLKDAWVSLAAETQGIPVHCYLPLLVSISVFRNRFLGK